MDDKYRRYQLKTKYDLSLDDVVRIISYQQGCCPFCLLPLTTERDTVDHDHGISDKRKSVRGILHTGCNTALGILERFPHLISGHVQNYLDKPPAQEALRDVLVFHPVYTSYRHARLSHAKAREIRTLRAEGVKRQALADQFGVSLAAVKDVLAGKTWRERP